MSHWGVSVSATGGLLCRWVFRVDPRSVRSGGCYRRPSWPPLHYRKSACLLPSAGLRSTSGSPNSASGGGSLPINIGGALVAAAVYLTEHALGPPRRVCHRGADSITLSLTPPGLLHPVPPMGAVLLPVPFPHTPPSTPPPSITIPIVLLPTCQPL
ncbi:hypothetical protein PBY51_016345 [Eleginops maclovinus]|uniref:Uncharacterized protein n=1 Tax=Eleginops maclovinus TaxID=56733 RepID=A0AAN7XKJ4_ELEMC|nr:hypothetical protein PBY51_016345 [Eleginops maclovinus]